MKLLKGKITAYGLLLLIAMPLLFSVIFLIRQRNMQEEAERNLEIESLQTISIPTSDLHWIEKDKEALIKGKLFDVKSYTVNGNTVDLTGLFDTKENELLLHYSKMMRQNNSTGSAYDHLTVKFLFLPVFNSPPTFSLQRCWQFVDVQFLIYAEMTRETITSFPAPPPRCV